MPVAVEDVIKSGRTCGTCACWIRVPGHLGPAWPCRRNPPLVLLVPVQTPTGTGMGFQAQWPMMTKEDFCIDGWRPAEGITDVP